MISRALLPQRLDEVSDIQAFDRFAGRPSQVHELGEQASPLFRPGIGFGLRIGERRR